MKTLLTTFASFFLFAYTQAQNVGIGTTAPVTPLHIAGWSPVFNALTLENITPKNGTNASYTLINFVHGGMNTGSIRMLNNQSGNSAFQVYLDGGNKLHVQSNGNVGIGTETPTHRLEVIGDMRVAGNMGVGVSTPTARLDVNGSFRLRTGAGFGRTLVSDQDGNATWQQGIAFRAQGTLDGVVYPIPKFAWAKVMFNQIARYNYGLGFQSVNSEFLVPYKGVYHFDVQSEFIQFLNGYSGIRLMVRRGGGSFSIAENHHLITTGVGSEELFNNQELPLRLGLDMQLEAGDFVYLEVSYGNGSPSQGITFEPSRTWFTGHMVMRVP